MDVCFTPRNQRFIPRNLYPVRTQFGHVITSYSIHYTKLYDITPFLFPVVMQALGLLTGLIQAYIFAVLAMVYIASATSAHQRTSQSKRS